MTIHDVRGRTESDTTEATQQQQQQHDVRLFNQEKRVKKAFSVLIRNKLHQPKNFCYSLHLLLGFPGGAEVKSVCLQCGRSGFDPWVRRIPWRRKWQPTPVFLLGESHGWRSLVGYSPTGRKESDTTERLHLVTFSDLVTCYSAFGLSWLREPHLRVENQQIFEKQSSYQERMLVEKGIRKETKGFSVQFFVFSSPRNKTWRDIVIHKSPATRPMSFCCTWPDHPPRPPLQSGI